MTGPFDVLFITALPATTLINASSSKVMAFSDAVFIVQIMIANHAKFLMTFTG